MRVLVTGAGGFLGQRLMATLRKERLTPIGTTRNPSLANAQDTFVLSDPLDPISYGRLIEEQQINAVVNALAAGVDPSDRNISRLIRANTVFPAELASAAKTAGAQIFVQIGSSAEYAGVKSVAMCEEGLLVQDKLYGATKAAGSLIVQSTASEVGLTSAVLRLFNIFGPGEKRYRLFPSLVLSLSRGESVAISAGTQIRDFLFVDDACRAIVSMLRMLCSDERASGIYNLASGNALSVRDFSLAVAAEIGADPQLLLFGAQPMRAEDLSFVVADTCRLDDLIGPASHTSLRDAIAAMQKDLEQSVSS